MSIAVCAAAVIISLICAPAAVWYQKAYITGTRPDIYGTIKQHRIMLSLLLVAFLAMSVMFAVTQRARNMRTDILIQNLLIWNGVFTAAVIDFQVKKIPNKIVAALLAVRAVFLILGIIAFKDDIKISLLRSVTGMILGGGVILVCMFFSKGGVGAGDMKLFAVIGFCFGLSGIVQVMVYTLFISAVFCIGLLISGKAKMHSTVPMAPFIVTGLTFYYILLS